MGLRLKQNTSPSSIGLIEMEAKQSKVCNVYSLASFIQFYKSCLETYENILNFKNITEVLERIVLIQSNHIKESFEKDELVKLLRNTKPQPAYPEGFFTIDLRHYFRGKNIKELVIVLNTSRLNSSTLVIGKVSFQSTSLIYK